MAKYLLDSHIYIWILSDDPRLSQKVRILLLDPKSALFVSDVSIWELAIKHMQGKLGYTIADLTDSVKEIGAVSLALKHDHIKFLPEVLLSHKDPFDKLICAQALCDELILVSADGVVLASNVTTLKA
jgi:PIN domain nuclease of toxin-antitoxin system